MNITNCIFSNISGSAISDSATSPTVEHCTLYNCDTGIDLTNSALSTVTIKNNILYKCGNDIATVDADGLEVQYCILGSNRSSQVTVDANSKENIDPLFVDENGEDFHLMRKANGYFVDSLAIDLSDDSRDCGAWDVSDVLASTTWDSLYFLDPPKSGSIDVEAVNIVSNQDVKGNLRESFDALKRTFIFDFTDYVRRHQTFQLINLYNDTGSMRFYPLGEDNSILEQVSEFDINIATMKATITSEVPLPKNWLQGWWLVLTMGGVEKHFYIVSNTNYTITLENKYGYLGLWDGMFSGKISYILVRVVHSPLSLKFDYFLDFKRGQSLNLNTIEDIDAGNTALEQYNNYTLSFKEVDIV